MAKVTSLLVTSHGNYFPYLGFPQNELLRLQAESRVEQHQRETLGWDTAFRAAKRFSDGKPCCKGEGAGHRTKIYTEEEGTFNKCYWIQVEGLDKQWVVRFPLLGKMSDQTTIRKLRSEVATLRFLGEKTTVPVPKVIGYGEGDSELPPFMIMENIAGMRMAIALGRDIPVSIFNKIFKQLAAIQLELLSHPANRIGMLDISDAAEESEVPQPTIGPYSIDVVEREIDGVSSTRPEPFTSSHDYYRFKSSVWKEQLELQQNAIRDARDGRRQALNESILRDCFNKMALPDDKTQFYLSHPDFHGSNVILDRSFNVVGIIDWEGACFLPLASSCIPLRCLFLFPLNRIQPNSPYYTEFESKTKRYIKILSEAEKTSSNCIKVSELMRNYVQDKSFFLIRGLDDVRYLDEVLWQHLAPMLYPELKERISKVILEKKQEKAEEINDGGKAIALAVDDVLRVFAGEQVESEPLRKQEIDDWVKRRIQDSKDYDRALAKYLKRKQGEYSGEIFSERSESNGA